MVFPGSNMRKYRRYPYLQFITFFSLGPQVSEGSRRAICVNLSDSGMCIYTPDRLSKGQALLFNDPLPVKRPKATVRWVKEHPLTGSFYKSGIMFSSRAEDDSLEPSRTEQGDPEDPPGLEKRSSVIESGNFASAAGNSDVTSTEDFWSDVAELSEREADQFIALTSEIMLNERMKDDVLLRLLRASAFFRKAVIISGRQGNHWDDHTLDLIEKSLNDFRVIDEHQSNGGRVPYPILKENRDTAAKALESRRPGRVQEILGKTKLAYVGNRLYLRNRQHAPSGEEMAIFENIFFHYPAIVRSAEIFYKVLGEPGRRYINVLLYKESSPRNSAGEANDPLSIICLVEDGTFHLVEDLGAETTDAEAGDRENSRPLQSGPESGITKTACDGNGAEVYLDVNEKEKSTQIPEGATGQAGGRAGKTVKLLIGCAIVLLLAIVIFLLKSHPPKSLPGPGKGLMPGPLPGLAQGNSEQSRLLSGAPDDLSSITGETKGLPKVKGHKDRQSSSFPGVRKKKRSQGAKANAEGQIMSNKGGTSREAKKRSFSPPSRDDL